MRRTSERQSNAEMELEKPLLVKNDELKEVNLDYQAGIRKIGSKCRKLGTENKQLKEENKELIDKMNELKKVMSNMASRSNQPPEPNPDDLLDEDRIAYLTKSLERLKYMGQEWKAACEAAERKLLELEEAHRQLQREIAEKLEKDPRIKQNISSAQDRKIEELTRQNLELEEKLRGKNEETSVDLTRVKQEKPTDLPESDAPDAPGMQK